MIILAVVLVLVLIAVIGGAHWYLWRRLVRDVSAPGSGYRRTGTVLIFLLPATLVASQAGAMLGMPFGVRQVISWPGFYWAALLLYLMLALLAGELVRPLLRIWLRRRDAAARPTADREREPEPEQDRALLVGAARSAPGGGPGTARPTGTTDADGSTGTTGGAGTTGAGGERPADDHPAEDPGRRLFIARTVAIGAATAAAATVGYGSYAARNLTTKHVTVPLAKLPRSADGYRIAVVSDIHLGPLMGESHCRRVVDAINRAQPDLITVVGDLVDGDVEDLRPAAAPLADLRARQGAYFVTGNHEYFSGAEQWIDHVRELGLVPLENTRVELDAFDLAGVNDLEGEADGQGPDFEAALGDRDRQRASVLMSHQPVTIHDAVDYGVDLQLSGHTHGGQLWPGPYLAALANPTVAGLERYGDTQLYVTRGAGAWGPPVRVGADPDITVVTLASVES
ncbi:metallophosphoesterase [Streptomyces aidingensis]|uniref:Calcineurin-like phosphoesterase domain-containing protein n=1 Tax=Streptomyces aidingensis TaxID=910347 RepID=A0A1I1EFN5_9ACTN|nr:metallophosphoesterase [Streptomyces aidingensis]SFB85911.1 hypothetical protein SAMN05421773_101286 [Streptomyces aidingensis]